MKRVPYKCRFGHITILVFYNGQTTLGIIECGKCEGLAGNLASYTKTDNSKSETRIRNGEKAVRI